MATVLSLVYLFVWVSLGLQSSARYLQADATLADCVRNTTYTVSSGDNCAKIASAHNVPRGALIAINGLRPECANLRIGQVLCLPEACQLYPVELGASCNDIIGANNLDIEQLFEWNAYLDAECTNLVAGDQVCVGAPGALQPTPAPTPTPTPDPTGSRTTGYATATVAPPGPVPRGTTKSCGQYYQVRSGDFCDSISDRFSIDLDLFHQINPAINTECTNLVPGLFYCVNPTEDWNQTTTTTQIATYTTAPGPTPSGTTPECYEWYVVRSGDTCNQIGSIYGISIEDFRVWNPSLRADCSNLRPGIAYCIRGEFPTPTPAGNWILLKATDTAPRDQ
ncbi:hypothetical protein BJY04DRAFT_143001 [Aspergillus karnatakaensis]|uniref:uncharacterized protein n=1 Tax=Aspergillus karnatakaensis TaxID=1810916 RepID=UPI003CCDD780